MTTGGENSIAISPILVIFLTDGTIQDWNFDYARDLNSLNRTSYDLKCLLDIHYELVKTNTGELYKIEISKIFNDSLEPTS